MPILFDRAGMIEQVYLNPETKVGKDLCPSHVIKVWKTINALIKRSLCSGKGMVVPRFFTITFKTVEVDTGSGDGTVLQRQPHVTLDEALVNRHSILMRRVTPHPFDLPETELNLAHLAKLCEMTREDVEFCLDEILIAYDRALVLDKQVELWLNKIGRIIVDNGAVRVAFCAGFLNLLGYSEEVKRFFVPNPEHGKLSDLMDYLHSPSPSYGEDIGEYYGEDGPPMDHGEVEGEGKDEKTDSLSDHPSMYSLLTEGIPDDKPKLERPVETEEDKHRRANAHRTLLERECVARETFLVWESISKYIIRKMLEGVAVRIAGLGTFTHSVLPNDLSRHSQYGRTLRKSRKFPIFKMCPHLKESNSLREENVLYHCNVPVMNLNVRVIANESKLTHGIVDGILTETLKSFAQGIITNKNLEFPFPFIGKLHVKYDKVFMLFYEEFCEGLEFNFRYDPSYISAVLPGQMTPLIYHRPTPHLESVFHYEQMKKVEEHIRIDTPCVYGGGKLVRDSEEDPCKFLQKLHLHSNLLFDCSCCKCTKKKNKAAGGKKQRECIGEEAAGDEDEDEGSQASSDDCGYSRNYERIQKACCAQQGAFSFEQPDGSKFSPEALFTTAKTGNPILDRLADDKCLMQQAIGCWMKRGFMKSLGAAELTKHYNRSYFRRIEVLRKGEKDGVRPRKSYLVRGILTPPPTPPNEQSVMAFDVEDDEEDEEPSPIASTDSNMEVAESSVNLPDFKDSMIMGKEEQRRRSSVVGSEGIRLSGDAGSRKSRSSKDSRKSGALGSNEMFGEVALLPGSEMGAEEEEVEDEEKGQEVEEDLGAKREGKEQNEEENEDEDEFSHGEAREVSETGSAKDTSEAEIRLTEERRSTTLGDIQKESNLDKGTTTEVTTDSKSPEEPGDDDKALVHVFGSEWFNEPGEEEGSAEDEEMEIHLEEAEVIKNLGIKHKKKCKKPSKLPPTMETPDEQYHFTQEDDAEDKKAPKKKKKPWTPVKREKKEPKPMEPKKEPKPREPHVAMASHNMAPKREYGRKVVKPKPKKPIIHQSTQTARDPYAPAPATRSLKGRTASDGSVVFKSGSSLRCCTPSASLATTLPPLDETSFRRGDEQFSLMRMALDTFSGTSGAPCGKRRARQHERCSVCPPLSSRWRGQDDQDQGGDPDAAATEPREWPAADGEPTKEWPATGTTRTPHPSYTRVCATQRKPSDVCYSMQGCTYPDLSCPGYSYVCDNAERSGNNPT